MSVNIVFNQMLIIFLLMITGFFLYKKSIITDEGNKLLSRLIVILFSPSMIISGVLSKSSPGGIKEVLTVMMIAACMFIALIIIGNIIPIILKVPADEKNIYNMMTIFGNIGFIGIPVTAALLGSEAIIYVVIFNLAYNVVIYTYGIYLITQGAEERPKYNLKSILNIGTISSIIAIIIFIFKIEFPYSISQTITYLSNATTSLSMISIGVSLGMMPLIEIFTDAKLYVFSIIRLLIIPIIAAVVLKNVISDYLIYGVTILMTAMPCGSLPVILAQTYGIDSKAAAKTVVLTTVLSLGTISIVSLFM